MSYENGSIIQVDERKLTILDNLPVSNGKKVYKVIIGEAKDKELGLLKLPSKNSKEIANTLTFFVDDTQSRMVQMITHDTIDNQIHLLLEFYEKGNLLDYLSDHEVSDEEKDTLILTILETGCYLHSKGYLHADIKPDNIFIDNDNNPRLGDLESMTELDDIHEDTIRDIHGTIGYKYSQGSSYNLSDELFAYIATIYFIEVEEILLHPSELADLDLGEDSVGAINAFVRTKINKITHTPLKNFLIQTLEDLENYEEIDCCSLLEQFEALPTRKALEEEISDPPGEGGTENPEKNPLLTLLKDIWNQVLAKRIPLTITVLAIVSFIYYFQREESQPISPDENISTLEHEDTVHNNPPEENITENSSSDLETVETVQKPNSKPPSSTESMTALNTPERPQEVQENTTMQTPQTEVIPKPQITPVHQIEPTAISQVQTLLPTQVTQQEEKITPLVKRIAALKTEIPPHRKVLHVDIPSQVQLGNTLNIKITSLDATGYLQLLLVDPNDIQTLVFKDAKYLNNEETLSFSIKTSKPSGLHYILVIFTANKYDFTLSNFSTIIKNFSNQSFGMEYVDIYPINIHE